MLAPICLFTYNRLAETKKTVEALQQNYLAKDSDLYVFSDGPIENNKASIEKVKAVRDYLKSVSGFKSVNVLESNLNKGLANSIIEGVSKIIDIHDKVIVLEDDLISSPNFLDFMNQSLDYYSREDSVFTISGYSMNLPSLKNRVDDYYVGYRASSWGWATWKNRWTEIDWGVDEYKRFKWNLLEQIQFMRGGSDMPRMLRRQMRGKIDSWAIRWCYHQFKNNLLTVYASKSKIMSIGFGESATHTKDSTRFETLLDKESKRDFVFGSNLKPDQDLVKEFRNMFSFKSRLLNALKF